MATNISRVTKTVQVCRNIQTLTKVLHMLKVGSTIFHPVFFCLLVCFKTDIFDGQQTGKLLSKVYFLHYWTARQHFKLQ